MNVSVNLNGPRPLCPPLILLSIFVVLLSITCGPTFNQNAVKEVWRQSEIFSELNEKTEIRMSEALRIFQTSDIIAGAVGGVILNYCGPRITSTIGHASYIGGLLMMLSERTLLWGMIAQAFSVQTTLSPTLCIANLFNKGSKIVISILFATSDLATFVYPVGLLLIELDLLTGYQVILVLVGVSTVALLLGVLLLPSKPFLPMQGTPTFCLAAELLHDRQHVQPQVNCKDDLPDLRDRWGIDLNDSDNNSETVEPDSPKYSDTLNRDAPTERTPLTTEIINVFHKRKSITSSSIYSQPKQRQRRHTNLSVSFLALSNPISRHPSAALPRNITSEITTSLLAHRHLISQLISAEYMLIVLIFAFSILRVNLYLDGNETILYNMGDHSHCLGREFSVLLPLGAITCVINGIVAEYIGVVPTLTILNTFAVAVNAISLIKSLALQRIAFVLFIFSKSSVFSSVFTYILETFGLLNFGLTTGFACILTGIVNELVGAIVIHITAVSPAKNWFAVNLILLVCGVVAFIPLLVLHYLKSNHRYPDNETCSEKAVDNP